MVGLSTTGQDENGHNRSYVKEVFGPIASLACTTKGEQYLDDMNRCFLLAVDESEAQTAAHFGVSKTSGCRRELIKAKREEFVVVYAECFTDVETDWRW